LIYSEIVLMDTAGFFQTYSLYLVCPDYCRKIPQGHTVENMASVDSIEMRNFLKN